MKVMASHFHERQGELLPNGILLFDRDTAIFGQLAADAWVAVRIGRTASAVGQKRAAVGSQPHPRHQLMIDANAAGWFATCRQSARAKD